MIRVSAWRWSVPGIPSRLIQDRYDDSPDCDIRLPKMALDERKRHMLLTQALSGYNITVWRVNVGDIEDADADPQRRSVFIPKCWLGALTTWRGFSAGQTRVLQIFTEREPCRHM
jgi:hypothetical protein